MKKKLLIPILAICIISFSSYGYYYVMYGGARDLSSEETAFQTSATAIATEFKLDPEISNKKYLEKAVAISGIVTKCNDTLITLNQTVICALKNPATNIKINQPIHLKGRVVGYDDLMEELKLDQCFIINK